MTAETVELKTFRCKPDYKAAFSEAVTELIQRGIKDRNIRIKEIAALIDEYVESTGERPDKRELYRLANEILREDFRDQASNKSRRDEKPILSDRQLARRKRRERPFESVEFAFGHSAFGRRRTARVKDDWRHVAGWRRLKNARLPEW